MKTHLIFNKAILSFVREEYDDPITCIMTASASSIEIRLECHEDNQYKVECPYTRDVIADSMVEACSILNYGNVWNFGVKCSHYNYLC